MMEKILIRNTITTGKLIFAGIALCVAIVCLALIGVNPISVIILFLLFGYALSYTFSVTVVIDKVQDILGVERRIFGIVVQRRAIPMDDLSFSVHYSKSSSGESQVLFANMRSSASADDEIQVKRFEFVNEAHSFVEMIGKKAGRVFQVIKILIVVLGLNSSLYAQDYSSCLEFDPDTLSSISFRSTDLPDRGTLITITFDDIELVYREEYYFTDSLMKATMWLLNDKLHGTFREYWQNGNLKQKSCWENGMTMGTSELYYENGNLMEVHNYKNSILDGQIMSYYESGGVELIGIMMNGERVGEWKYFDEEGNETHIESY